LRYQVVGVVPDVSSRRAPDTRPSSLVTARPAVWQDDLQLVRTVLVPRVAPSGQ